MKIPLRILISRQKQALKASHPKSRDRIRHRLQVLLLAKRLRKESKAA